MSEDCGWAFSDVCEIVSWWVPIPCLDTLVCLLWLRWTGVYMHPDLKSPSQLNVVFGQRAEKRRRRESEREKKRARLPSTMIWKTKARWAFKFAIGDRNFSVLSWGLFDAIHLWRNLYRTLYFDQIFHRTLNNYYIAFTPVKRTHARTVEYSSWFTKVSTRLRRT